MRIAFYRLRQFWRGLLAQIDPAELQAIRPILPPAAYALFCRLPVDAQRHSLNVLHDLQQQGAIPPDLAVAALLHDVGKLAADEAGVSISLWWRGPLVLIKAFMPTVLQRWQSKNSATGWRYALYVNQAHPQIGADLAREAGCSELACWLIEEHQGRGVGQALLARLQMSDARN